MAAAVFVTPTKDQPVVAPAQVSYLSQGWSPAIREAFHYTPQGSELVPYYWFLNLVEPDGHTLFKDDLDRFGVVYDRLTPDPGHLNPDGLPIGFVQQQETQSLGPVAEKRWLGLTCAACHTGELVPKGGSGALKQGTIIIDGAPARIDVAAMLTQLRASVSATQSDPVRLRVLAQKVLSAGDGSSVADIETRFKQYAQDLNRMLPLYLPKTPGGPGRLDCIGAIFNRICSYDIKGQGGPPARLDAPVNFPFIWYTNRQDHIQWFGGVPNSAWLERLARNTGEVCGVFARVDVDPARGLKGYASSINATGLGRIDAYVNSLAAPKWTDVFPAPDASAVGRGCKVFVHTCQTGGCHQDLAAAGAISTVRPTPLLQDPQNNPWNLPDLDTDPNNTRLVHEAVSGTGVLQGRPMNMVEGQRFGSTAPSLTLLNYVVAGSLLGHAGPLLDAYVEHLLHDPRQGRNWLSKATWAQAFSARQKAGAAISKKSLSSVDLRDDFNRSQTGFDAMSDGYESRSLNGIWATAPYLHNGSVPNLFELLWPDKRESRFYIGSLVYDPVKAGYVSDGSAGGQLFDTSLPGNSNRGHTYGSSLTAGQKSDLLAYLKTL
jgi:hypothetical protein